MKSSQHTQHAPNAFICMTDLLVCLTTGILVLGFAGAAQPVADPVPPKSDWTRLTQELVEIERVTETVQCEQQKLLLRHRQLTDRHPVPEVPTTKPKPTQPSSGTIAAN